MALVYPTPKIMKVREDNPDYWALLLHRSQYSKEEIEQTLTSIETVNTQLHNLKSAAYDLLEGQGHIQGWASEDHQHLNFLLSQADYINPSYSQNSHVKDCLPIRKWQKEVDQLYKQMGRITKQVCKIKPSTLFF